MTGRNDASWKLTRKRAPRFNLDRMLALTNLPIFLNVVRQPSINAKPNTDTEVNHVEK